MQTKFIKGQKVIRFKQWSEKGCECCYEFFTVKSCGKKQMTLEKENNGKMLQEMIYAYEYSNIFSASDFTSVEDVIVKALEFSAKYRDKAIAMYNDRLIRFADGSPSYLKSMQQGLEIVKTVTPKALSRNEALASINIKPEVR